MDAFDAAIGERIPWLPDETLFSWCSRYHYLAVNGLASATCLQLFGRRRQGVAHDLPSGITALAERARGSLGTASDIIRDRTILAFYAPFRSTELIADAERRISGDGIDALKYRLGLLTSGLGAAHPLKACASCMRDDRERFRVAYWHRVHQLPSTWFCPIHAEQLLVSPLKLHQRARFQWVLPQDACLAQWRQLGNSEPKGGIEEIGMRIAELGASVCALPAGALAEPALLADTYRHGLAKRGWVTRSGRAKWISFDSDLRHHASVLSALPPMAMQVNLDTAHSQLGRILAGRTLSHPLRYLAWMPLLFDSLAEFQTIFASPAQCSALTEPPSSPQDERKDLRPAIAIDSLRVGHETATAVARRLGVTVMTVAAWAAAAGITTARRPKVLQEPLWNTAVQLLGDGCEKSYVAEKCGVSIVTVTRVLRNVPGLQSSWHHVRGEIARDHARKTWLTAAAACRVLGIAVARKFEPATYAWLYRNDRIWLREQCILFEKCRGPGNHADIRLRRADERYARGLKVVLDRQASLGVAYPTSMRNWLAFAPGLRRVIKSPDCWPNTLLVLQTATYSRASLAVASLF